MTLFWILGLSALVVIAIISMINSLTFPRLGAIAKDVLQEPLNVSILIPARNEAGVIGDTVSAWLRQDYPSYEIIVLDDGSTDGTAQRAIQAGKGDPRLRVVSGEPLPSGWTGKNWACSQLAGFARGEVFVFSDADVRWAPQALSSLVAWLVRERADMLTVWPTQETITWSERLVVPMMMYVVIAYLPEILVRMSPWAAFAAANGQCLVFRRKAYERVGGHVQVKGDVIEDVALARRAKRAGLRLVMALGDRLISCRMYTNWGEVHRGFAKNILAGHGRQPLFLLLSAGFHWLTLVVPWAWFIAGWFVPLGSAWPEVPLAMIALGVGARALSAAVSGHAIRDALLLPLSALLMTVIATQSLWWHFRYGGPQWKGRQLSARVGL